MSLTCYTLSGGACRGAGWAEVPREAHAVTRRAARRVRVPADRAADALAGHAVRPSRTDGLRDLVLRIHAICGKVASEHIARAAASTWTEHGSIAAVKCSRRRGTSGAVVSSAIWSQQSKHHKQNLITLWMLGITISRFRGQTEGCG